MLYISCLFLDAAKGREWPDNYGTVQAEVAPSCAQPHPSNAGHVLLDPEKYKLAPTSALMRELDAPPLAGGCLITRAYLDLD